MYYARRYADAQRCCTRSRGNERGIIEVPVASELALEKPGDTSTFLSPCRFRTLICGTPRTNNSQKERENNWTGFVAGRTSSTGATLRTPPHVSAFFIFFYSSSLYRSEFRVCHGIHYINHSKRVLDPKRLTQNITNCIYIDPGLYDAGSFFLFFW